MTVEFQKYWVPTGLERRVDRWLGIELSLLEIYATGGQVVRNPRGFPATRRIRLGSDASVDGASAISKQR